MSILAKFSKNFDFGHNLRKIPFFFRKFRKISIWVKLLKKFDFGQIFEKFRFWSKFSKIFDLFENFEKFRFWSNSRKISILVEISNNFENFQKYRFWWKLRQNFDFGQIFDFGQNIGKILIFFENFEIFRLGLNFWIISIWVKFSK